MKSTVWISKHFDIAVCLPSVYTAFHNVSVISHRFLGKLYHIVSWVSYQKYLSIYPETSESVIRLTSQSQGSHCRSPLSPNGDYLMKTAITLLIWQRKTAIILFCNWIKKNRLLIKYESVKTRANKAWTTLFISISVNPWVCKIRFDYCAILFNAA